MEGTIQRMRKIALAILISIALLFPAAAEEVFYSRIINASYLSDFAMSAFPVSFWGEFGIDHLDIFPDLNTKALVRVEAGLAQRTLHQMPSDGSIITDKENQERYSVVFSEGLVGFEQGLVDNPAEGKPDFLTMSLLVGVRWEQAFASLDDIQSGDHAGFFDDAFFFPKDESGETLPVIGVPELNGNRYSLSNSVTLSFRFNNKDNNYLTPEGYDFSFSFIMGPWWLLNNPTVFNTSSTIDYWKLYYTASYAHTFMQADQEDADMNLFSLSMDFSFACQMLFGSAIPQHEMSISFRGDSIPPRPFIADVRAGFSVVGPEFLSVGTYPKITAVVENALAAGRLLNSSSEIGEACLYGTVGMRFELYIMGLFRAIADVYYDYLVPEGSTGGFDVSFGAYFIAAF